MKQREFLLIGGTPILTPSQKRSVSFLVACRGWSREYAEQMYTNNNVRVAKNRMARKAKHD